MLSQEVVLVACAVGAVLAARISLVNLRLRAVPVTNGPADGNAVDPRSGWAS
jgi:hypothetical protein